MENKFNSSKKYFSVLTALSHVHIYQNFTYLPFHQVKMTDILDTSAVKLEIGCQFYSIVNLYSDNIFHVSQKYIKQIYPKYLDISTVYVTASSCEPCPAKR